MPTFREFASWVGLKGVVMVVGPVIVVALTISSTDSEYALAFRAGGVALLMALWWMTEAVPLAVTALLPIVLFPIMNVLSSSEVPPLYLNDTTMAMLGTFILAAAMEKWELHRRLALRLLLTIGGRPWGVLLSFMLSTTILSMFLSNTATVTVMVPLVEAVMSRLRRQSHIEDDLDNERDGGRDSDTLPPDTILSDDGDRISLKQIVVKPAVEEIELQEQVTGGHESPSQTIDETSMEEALTPNMTITKEEVNNFHSGILLTISYSSAMGGVCTPVGTGPNLVFLNIIKVLFPLAPPVSFAAWMGFAIPMAVLFQGLLFGYFVWRRCPKKMTVSVEALQEEYTLMGPITLAEVLIIVDLAVLVLMWLLRSFSLLGSMVGDGTLAIAASVILFFLPASKQSFHCGPNQKPTKRILEWPDSKNVSWGVLLLLGGGFALAAALRKAGLTAMIAVLFAGLRELHPFLLVLIIVAAVTFITELMSNVAVANLVLPVLAASAVAAQQNPLLLMLPAAIASSFAFMLPAATPPNAIIMASGRVHAPDMARVGLMTNIVGIILLTSSMFAWGLPILGITLGEVPAWAVPS